MNKTGMMIPLTELGQNPGESYSKEWVASAPAELSNPMLRVPEGGDISLQMTFETVQEGIFTIGTLKATAVGECSRCLDPIELDLNVPVEEMFLSAQAAEQQRDDEAQKLGEDFLDLTDTIRDAVISALPFQPVCKPDCLGLCAECGARLNDTPEHEHENIDPRWEALRGLWEESAETPYNGSLDRQETKD